MTEDQKQRWLADFQKRAAIAEERGLPETAKSWRDRYNNLLKANAADVICVDRNPDEQEHVA